MLDIDAATLARLLGPALIDAPPRPLSVAGTNARLGFPSPAEDFEDDQVDLHHLLVRNAAATFLYRAEGWSMLHVGICDGDILVVDRSVTAVDGDIVIATWEGNQPTCKILRVKPNHIELHSRNPHCANIVLAGDTDAEIFAVVGVARQIRRERNVRAR